MIPFGFELGDFRGRDIEADDLGIDLAFANPPRDDLGVLRTEIEDEDFRMGATASVFTDSARRSLWRWARFGAAGLSDAVGIVRAIARPSVPCTANAAPRDDRSTSCVVRSCPARPRSALRCMRRQTAFKRLRAKATFQSGKS